MGLGQRVPVDALATRSDQAADRLVDHRRFEVVVSEDLDHVRAAVGELSLDDGSDLRVEPSSLVSWQPGVGDLLGERVLERELQLLSAVTDADDVGQLKGLERRVERTVQ